MSYLDGTDEDIYVYNDKIIVEKNSYFPIGQYSYTHCKIIKFIIEIICKLIILFPLKGMGVPIVEFVQEYKFSAG